jgi:hypothetical protein
METKHRVGGRSVSVVRPLVYFPFSSCSVGFLLFVFLLVCLPAGGAVGLAGRAAGWTGAAAAGWTGGRGVCGCTGVTGVFCGARLNCDCGVAGG